MWWQKRQVFWMLSLFCIVPMYRSSEWARNGIQKWARMLAALMRKWKATFVSGVFDFSFQLKLLLIWVCFSHAHIIKILCLYQNSEWKKFTIKHGLEFLVNAVSDKMDTGYLACTASFSGTLDHCHCLKMCYCFCFWFFFLNWRLKIKSA